MDIDARDEFDNPFSIKDFCPDCATELEFNTNTGLLECYECEKTFFPEEIENNDDYEVKNEDEESDKEF